MNHSFRARCGISRALIAQCVDSPDRVGLQLQGKKASLRGAKQTGTRIVTTCGVSTREITGPMVEKVESSDTQLQEFGLQAKLIVTDVDGTLLDSKQTLTDTTTAILREAASLGVPTVVATGKTRGPWTDEVLPALGCETPGVFCQGLVVTDAKGNLCYSNTLPDDIAKQGIKFAENYDVTVIAFCMNQIMCEEKNAQTDRALDFGEAEPVPVGPLLDFVGTTEIHKLILLGDPDEIERLRPAASEEFEGRAALTSAIEGMLEILPFGASKGQAVEWLLDQMQIDPANVIAFGDGENDIELLQLAGVGVAMGNANEKLKGVADVFTKSNNEDGMARAVEEIILAPRRQAANWM